MSPSSAELIREINSRIHEVDPATVREQGAAPHLRRQDGVSTRWGKGPSRSILREHAGPSTS